MDIDPRCVKYVVVRDTAESDLRRRAYAQDEAVFPASAPMPNGAQVQEQEVAALARVLRDAKARFYSYALEEVAIICDGHSDAIQVSLEDARLTGRSMAAQFHEQTETIAALQEKASGLQARVTVRDAEIDRLHVRLRIVQRASAAQVKVSRAAICYFAHLILLTCFYSHSTFARPVYVLPR